MVFFFHILKIIDELVSLQKYQLEDAITKYTQLKFCLKEEFCCI